MKKITKIFGKNVKGKSFDVTLTPVTVCVGENESGKTAVLQALELSATGKVSGIGSQSHVLFERLASGPDMMVAFKSDDGSGVTRSYFRSKKGVNATVGVTGGLAADWTAPTILFDQSEFLGLSGTARTKYLFSVLPPPPLDKVGPAAIKAQVKNIKLEPHTEHAEKAIESLCAFVDETYKLDSGVVVIQDWLSQLVEQVREKGNGATATAKRFKETILGVAQLKSPDAASLAAAEGAVRKATAEHEQAVKELATVREKYRAKKAELDAAEALAASYAVPEPGLRERLEAKVEELRPMVVVKIGTPNLGDRPSSDAERKAMSEAIEAGNVLLRASKVAKAEVERILGLIENADHVKNCPTCGQSVEENNKKMVKGYKAQLKIAQENYATADAALKQYKDADKIQAWNEAEQRIKDYDEAHKKAFATYYNAAQAEWTEASNLLRITESQLQSLKDSAAKEAPAKVAAESLPKLREQLDDLQQRGEIARSNEGLKNTMLADADKTHKQAVADAASAQQQQKAAEAADQAQAEADVLKQAGQLLVALLAECVRLSVKPLLDTANQLCEGILSSPLAMQDGELGMEKATGFVGWRSFSGTAQSLAFTAIGIALAVGSELKLAIIDDCGRLSPRNKEKLLARVVSLVANATLNQAIIVDADTEFWRGKMHGPMGSMVEIKD